MKDIAPAEAVLGARTPAVSLIVGVILVAAFEALARHGTLVQPPVVAAVGIEREAAGGVVGELLREDIAGERGREVVERGQELAAVVDEVVVLPAVGVVVLIGRVRPETALGEVEVQPLRELVFRRITALAAERDLVARLVGDDVDHTADGVRAVERRSRPVEHLNALDARHVDLPKVDVAADVARQLAAVDEQEDVAVRQAVHRQVGAHRVGRERQRGDQRLHGLLEVGDAGAADVRGRNDRHGGRRVFQALVCPGAGDHDGVQPISPPGRVGRHRGVAVGGLDRRDT